MTATITLQHPVTDKTYCFLVDYDIEKGAADSLDGPGYEASVEVSDIKLVTESRTEHSTYTTWSPAMLLVELEKDGEWPTIHEEIDAEILKGEVG